MLLPSGDGQPFEAGIYIHWPFCARKCPYCDFNSHVRASVDHQAWLDGLLAELDTIARLYPNLRVASIFFGGGTPSLMPASTVAGLLDRIDHLFGLKSSIEVTLEANPSSVESDRFMGYRAGGVNRLSMGFQSLRDQSLRFLGRLHSANEALKALEIARSHFSSVSFDLIYALPSQTPDDWEQELLEALALGPDHLSLYQLTIEEGTAFWYKARRGDLVIPDEDTATVLFELTHAMTHAAGLPRYEVSNHARLGRESQHNLGYWQGRPYVGIGPGAHGRLPKGKAVVATSQIKRPEDWLKSALAVGWGGADLDPVSRHDRAIEQLMMGLRLAGGVDLSLIEATLGHDPIKSDEHGLIDPEKIEDCINLSLLERTDRGLKATSDGMLLLNRLVSEILR